MCFLPPHSTPASQHPSPEISPVPLPAGCTSGVFHVKHSAFTRRTRICPSVSSFHGFYRHMFHVKHMLRSTPAHLLSGIVSRETTCERRSFPRLTPKQPLLRKAQRNLPAPQKNQCIQNLCPLLQRKPLSVLPCRWRPSLSFPCASSNASPPPLPLCC